MAKHYLDTEGLEDYTGKLTTKYKTIFASKTDVGTPLVAATASAMTDTTKIYVYTGSETGYTAGNWYYYNGSAWVSGGIYNSIAVETDTTLSESGMAADAKATGDAIEEIDTDITDLKNAFLPCNDINALGFAPHTDVDQSGVTYDWTGNSCYVHGTATALSGYYFWNNTTSMPWWITPGKKYKLKFSGRNVGFQIYTVVSGTSTLLLNTTTDAEFTIPANATGMTMRLRVGSGTTVNETVTPLLIAEYDKDTNIVDPDDFAGTDNEKLAAAMEAAGFDGNSVILITRTYNLSANVLLNHNHESNGRMIFLGVGKDCGFNQAQYGFKAPTSTRSYGMISFVNIKFKATNIYFVSDYLIRVFFENCSFDGGNHVIYNTHYLQTWYLHNCVIRDTYGYVVDSRGTDTWVLDLQFNQCLVERCNGFMIAYRFHGAYVSQCCIEALYNLTAKAIYDCRNLVFVNNYFEGNNSGTYLPSGATAGNGEMFDFTSTQENTSHVTIDNNRFVQVPGNEIILLRQEPYSQGYITVRNNFCTPKHGNYATGVYLVKTATGTTKVHNDVIIEGNGTAWYSDSAYLIDRSKATIAYTHELANSDDANTIEQPGYYHGASGNTIAHAPTTGEFYLQHIKTDSGFAQFAITGTGVKSRIGTGAWV